jgi:hypothetical protein
LLDIIVTVEEVVVIDITDILDDVMDKDWFTPYFGMEILLELFDGACCDPFIKESHARFILEGIKIDFDDIIGH